MYGMLCMYGFPYFHEATYTPKEKKLKIFGVENLNLRKKFRNCDSKF